ncbi:MAG TPA: acetylornithine/succinylornithine family transaminase [Acidobacteria bacterium]|nr:acetylornithine/succinylornithine family transaminase [Acidobacteriota bacterium]HIM15768.1 acetylornithine/succinylornithine family transaminase [Acidobacteriota bacterium]
MTTRSEQIIAKEAEHVLQVYKRIPIMFVRGQGSHLIDEHGQKYLDLFSGIGVASLGHAHTELADIIGKQAHELLHTSNLYFHPLQAEVASRLSRLSGLTRTFFCNSGTEAVEACLKFARRYWYSQGDKNRSGIVAFDGSFHGRTFGSLSVTAGEPYRAPFAPLLPGIRFVSPLDIDQIEKAITDQTAAVIVEPIQGEGGVRPIPTETAQALAGFCRTTQTLLIADEVQCGLGRTGQPFYSSMLGLTPDLMSLGKALGAGIPIGAALLSEKVSSSVSYGDHGSTYGGNLLACQAALVFLNALEAGLIQRVADAGERLRSGLEKLVSASDELHEVRGAGLMCGIEVDIAVADQIVNTALEHKLLINRTAGTVVRLLPPLTISNEDIDDGLIRLRAAFSDAGAQFH